MRARFIIAFLLVAGAAVANQPGSPTGIDPQPPAARPEENGAVPEWASDMVTLDRRLTVLENKSPPAWYVPFVLTLLSTGFGIAVGSLITARYTNRAEARADRLRREDAAISVASEWIKMFPSLQHVYKCLGSPDLLREAKNLNAVLDPGDWLEITAQRLQQDLIDRDLLKKMGLIDRMSVFLDKYDHAAGNWQTRNPRLISDYIPAHGPHLVSKYRRRRGRDMPSQNRLIEALDHSVDLLIKLKVLARSEKISSQSNEEIMQALKELDCRIAGMVVDPVPVEKSGIICTYCSTSVKVTLS